MFTHEQHSNGAGPNLLIWDDRSAERLKIACRCGVCSGLGTLLNGTEPDDPGELCAACAGAGWLGLDWRLPTTGLPGSLSKIAMLCARCAVEAPLWHARDADYEYRAARLLPRDMGLIARLESLEFNADDLDGDEADWDSYAAEAASDRYAAGEQDDEPSCSQCKTTESPFTPGIEEPMYYAVKNHPSSEAVD